jgi:hypothetical protein
MGSRHHETRGYEETSADYLTPPEDLNGTRPQQIFKLISHPCPRGPTQYVEPIMPKSALGGVASGRSRRAERGDRNAIARAGRLLAAILAELQAGLVTYDGGGCPRGDGSRTPAQSITVATSAAIAAQATSARARSPW